MKAQQSDSKMENHIHDPRSTHSYAKEPEHSGSPCVVEKQGRTMTIVLPEDADGETDTHSCTKCKLVFTNLQDYITHKLSRDNCKVSYTKSRGSKGLVPHLVQKEVPTKKPPYAGRKRGPKGPRINHPENNIIQNPCGYQCEKCSKSFRRQAALSRHLEFDHSDKHGSDEEAADEDDDDDDFDTSPNFVPNAPVKKEPMEIGPEAVQEIYTEDPQHKTLFSDSSVGTGGNMVRIYHGDTSSQATHVQVVMQNGKEMDSDAEQFHISKTRPFGCEICSRSFKDFNVLKTHMLTHSDERQYPCDWEGCTYAFKTKGSLKRHMRRHTGERPFKCELCGRSFGESGALTRHLKSRNACTNKSDNDLPRYGRQMAFRQDIPAAKGNKTEASVNGEESSSVSQPLEDIGETMIITKPSAEGQLFSTEDIKAIGDATGDANIAERLQNAEQRLIVDENGEEQVLFILNNAKSKSNDQETDSENEENITCEVCDEEYQSKEELLKHLKTHLTVLPYKCDFCPYAVATEHELKVHLHITHKVTKNTEVDPSSDVIEETPQQSSNPVQVSDVSANNNSSTSHTEEQILTMDSEEVCYVRLEDEMESAEEINKSINDQSLPGIVTHKLVDVMGQVHLVSQQGTQLVTMMTNEDGQFVGENSNMVLIESDNLEAVVDNIDDMNNIEISTQPLDEKSSIHIASDHSSNLEPGKVVQVKLEDTESNADDRIVMEEVSVERIQADCVKSETACKDTQQTDNEESQGAVSYDNEEAQEAIVCNIEDSQDSVSYSIDTAGSAEVENSEDMEELEANEDLVMDVGDVTHSSEGNQSQTIIVSALEVAEEVIDVQMVTEDNITIKTEKDPTNMQTEVVKGPSNREQEASKALKQFMSLKKSDLPVHKFGRRTWHSCPVCTRKFRASAYLKLHMRSHTGEKPHDCLVCKKTFMTRDSLMKHMVVHSAERNYKCGDCGKLFKRISHVREHLKVHSSDRPYPCMMCDKSFKSTNACKVHMRTHTDYLPFECKFCHRNFREKGSLNRHERTHTGEKPYQCKYCGRPFAEHGTLNRHLKAKVPCHPSKPGPHVNGWPYANYGSLKPAEISLIKQEQAKDSMTGVGLVPSEAASSAEAGAMTHERGASLLAEFSAVVADTQQYILSEPQTEANMMIAADNSNRSGSDVILPANSLDTNQLQSSMLIELQPEVRQEPVQLEEGEYVIISQTAETVTLLNKQTGQITEMPANVVGEIMSEKETVETECALVDMQIVDLGDSVTDGKVTEEENVHDVEKIVE